MCRAKLFCIAQLAVYQVYADDRSGAGQRTPLDDIESYTTAADHHRTTAGLNLGGIDRRAYPGHDATAYQACFVERHGIRNLDARDFRYHRVLRETGDPGHMVDGI